MAPIALSNIKERPEVTSEPPIALAILGKPNTLEGLQTLKGHSTN